MIERPVQYMAGWMSEVLVSILRRVRFPHIKKTYQLEPNDRQRKRRQRTSETVAGIVPYESSLAEHGLKLPAARGRRPIYNSSQWIRKLRGRGVKQPRWAIDSAQKTIQHEVGWDCKVRASHDVVDQCEFGRLPSRPVITEKDVKYEERAVGCKPQKTPLVMRPMNKTLKRLRDIVCDEPHKIVPICGV